MPFLLPALESGRLDLAIVYDVELPPGFQRRISYETELQPGLPVDHRLATQILTGPTRSGGLRPTIVAYMPQVILVQALVARGLGYSLLMARPNCAPVSLEGLPMAVRP